ncbi:predicted protein [Sclerotinia sclerotiorum 1980 UF-70]|uniref:Uncharacterized protein n=1 Tax=Sclerotinia sclerotiorum (strain ATCC 18683 / 1980 / Ss-1) TaxID=665079 RepID=A7F185_SCLS1|nr:predicted protein [Sclerotinia sclerotiorum 1980 UF-70]EDN95477.1 predicted protein [Sclerotinia sclerotiorum 1980 UF-70]
MDGQELESNCGYKMMDRMRICNDDYDHDYERGVRKKRRRGKLFEEMEVEGIVEEEGRKE